MLIRFMMMLPAQRIAIIKTMMRKPVIEGTPPLLCTMLGHEAQLNLPSCRPMCSETLSRERVESQQPMTD